MQRLYIVTQKMQDRPTGSIGVSGFCSEAADPRGRTTCDMILLEFQIFNFEL